jgi:predicted RNA-binding protein YlxR (DUF448 family)
MTLATEPDDLTTDDGTPCGVAAPVRRCLATGRRAPRDSLIRFVLSPDGVVTPDLSADLPGRGMWLSADAQSIKTALDRRLFAKCARRAVDAPADLADRVAGLLTRRCVDAISLARRAGEAVCGFEKTRAAVAGGQAAVLLQARDGAADGRAKLAALAARQTPRDGDPEDGDPKEMPVIDVLAASDLGRAFGRDHAVHAALAPGGLSRRFLTEARRLHGFVSATAGDGPDGKDEA